MNPATRLVLFGKGQPMLPPYGFDWTPPVRVYRHGAHYTTDYKASDWMVPATASLWCSPAGNDSTGNGTQGTPYRSIKKCLTAAALLSDTAITIYAVAGEYGFGGHFSNQSCAKDLNVIAVGGRVLATNKFPVSSWTADGTGTYKTTRSGIAAVRDALYPDVYGLPAILTTAASTAACQAAAGSWYTDGTTVWVHLSDGRVPDANGATDKVALIFGAPSLLFNTDNRWFIQGIDFEGSSTDLIRSLDTSLTSASRIVMDDCTYRMQNLGTAKTVSALGIGTVILNRCKGYYSAGDIFNYHQGTTNLVNPKAIEINCEGYVSGASGGDNHFNCSTSHEGVRILRVNCTYGKAYGPIVADIGTTQAWNINVTAADCLLGTSDSQDASFQRGDGATGTTWNIDCNASGSHYSMYADVAGAQFYYRGGSLAGATSGLVAQF